MAGTAPVSLGIDADVRDMQTVEESLSATFGDIEWAIAEAERCYGTAAVPQEDT